MVQKWAIGAMINISGSISINLGTNLMKLSHKVNTTLLLPKVPHVYSSIYVVPAYEYPA